MSAAAVAVEAVQSILADVPAALALTAALVVIMGVLCLRCCTWLMRWTANQLWWPAAAPRQKQLMLNFGYAEEDCTTKAIVECWAYVLVACLHHFLAGCLLLPVCVAGWDGAGAVGQLLFYAGILLELAYDAFDSFRGIALRFFSDTFKFMEPVPWKPFIIMVVCHHQLAVIAILPMLMRYPHATEFHRMACSLLLAAAVSYASGAYKFTLDTSAPGGFMRYKAVVVFQLVVILYTRAWLWMRDAYSILARFNNDGTTVFFFGGFIAILLMSFFNLALIADATSAALKWLPQPMPKKAGKAKAGSSARCAASNNHLEVERASMKED